jgi:hypothetical protein|tara:strand:+ start:282 stop:731 length:450 start_codon:yes stop_codon:yes gene_type:complete
MKQIKFLILGILFVVAGFLLGLGVNQSSDSAVSDTGLVIGESTIPASMMIDTGDDLLGFNDLEIREQETAWSLLEGLSKESEELSVSSTDYGDLGVLIESINEYENGADKNYWQYWVNNKYADIAANNYVISSGDVILWKFTSAKYENY